MDIWDDVQPLIRPSQTGIGWAWIMRKVEDGFNSEANAQAEMDSSHSPAVLGLVDGKPWMFVTDDHHTLAALDFSGYGSKVTTTFNIVCDLRTLSEADFWNRMAARNLTLLVATPANNVTALPAAILPSAMPKSMRFTEQEQSLPDDPWRSMAGFSRKVQAAAKPAPACSKHYKYCERCFFRGCGDGSQIVGPHVSFFEFRWAYAYVAATYHNTSYWPSASEAAAFTKAFESLLPVQIGSIDTTAWLHAAEHIVSLCRATNLGSFPLPNLYAGNGKLPGYVEGYAYLDAADPTCSPASC